MEKIYDRVLFNKALTGDDFGVTPPPPTAIEYIEEEAELLRAAIEVKKKKDKVPTKATGCSPGKEKRGKKALIDEESASSSEPSDSRKL